MNKFILYLLAIVWCGVPLYAEKIKLYAFYTPSHEVLYKWFSASLQDDFELVIEVHPQECPSGTIVQAGWMKTMLRKVDLILRAIRENEDKIFIHADVDIQFFRSFAAMVPDLMKDKDMVIQKEDPQGNVCAGFFMGRGNAKMLDLWMNVRNMILTDPTLHDQAALNKIIRNPDYRGITWDYLPDVFYGGGTLTGDLWNPGMTLPIPDDIVMHHANWTIGVKNKILQLGYVRRYVLGRLNE